MKQTTESIIAHHIGAMLGAIESARQKEDMPVELDLAQLRAWLEYAVRMWMAGEIVQETCSRGCKYQDKREPDTCIFCGRQRVNQHIAPVDTAK